MKKQYIIPTIQIIAIQASSLMAVSSIDDIQIVDRESDGDILARENPFFDVWDDDWSD